MHQKLNVSITNNQIQINQTSFSAHLCEEASKLLLATRSCFGHTSIDYTCQINVLFTQHKVELIELFLSYINFHKAFFHQGYELLSIDMESDFHSISTQVNSIKLDIKIFVCI